MSDYANGLVKVVVFFGVINRVPATTLAHVFCYSAVPHTGTPEWGYITGALPLLSFERVGNEGA